MIREVALTTNDNPFDPLDEFENWFKFDIQKNYNSCSYLARIARVSDAMTEEERTQEQERAIDEIIKYDFRKIYKKVVRESN